MKQIDRKVEALESAKELIAEVMFIPAADIEAEHSLVDDLVMDSLELLDLLMHVEERWGIQIDESGLKRLRTVADVAAVLARQMR